MHIQHSPHIYFDLARKCTNIVPWYNMHKIKAPGLKCTEVIYLTNIDPWAEIFVLNYLVFFWQLSILMTVKN